MSTIIKLYETRGKKHGLEIIREPDNTYTIRVTNRGRTGYKSVNHTLQSAMGHARMFIQDSAEIDGINLIEQGTSNV